VAGSLKQREQLADPVRSSGRARLLTECHTRQSRISRRRFRVVTLAEADGDLRCAAVGATPRCQSVGRSAVRP
jgi:hypothetical protein